MTIKLMVIFIFIYIQYVYKNMLDYSVLSHKPRVVSVKDDEFVEYIDLTEQTYKGEFVKGGRVIYVEKYYIARPDLISLAVYGNDKYGDIICKINGISNPFELNEGMILYVPDISVIDKLILGTRTNSDILDEFKTIKSKNASITSSNYKGNGSNETIERNKKVLQKYRNERRSPGEQTVTDNNFVIDKSLGLIIY